MRSLFRSAIASVILLANAFGAQNALANDRGEKKQVFGNYEVHFARTGLSFYKSPPFHDSEHR